jgi:hypothetical protein
MTSDKDLPHFYVPLHKNPKLCSITEGANIQETIFLKALSPDFTFGVITFESVLSNLEPLELSNKFYTIYILLTIISTQPKENWKQLVHLLWKISLDLDISTQ